MIEAKSKEFQTASGTVILSLNQLDGMKATGLFLRLAKQFGPALVSAKGKDKLSVIGDLAAALDPAEFEKIMGTMLNAGCIARWPSEDRVEPEAGAKLGSIFHGKPFEIFKVFMFALETNFGDFGSLTQGLIKPA